MLIQLTREPLERSAATSRPAIPALALIALSALSLPSLFFVWHNRDVPHFGVLQDDGIYDIGGKALSQGAGYRILSLPDAPYQTKYPPLYPLYLSLAWRINPAFPGNLPIAAMLSWLSFPVVLLLLHLWCRRQGLPPTVQWLVVGLFGLNPYVLFFLSNLGSEMFFMMFLFAALLAADRGTSRSALLAGVLAGAGYLARTAGIAFLPAAIAYYLWKKQPRQALWFTLGMLPALAGWSYWNATHAAPGWDVATLCYTNYIRYQLYNVGWDNFGVVLWNNLSSLLESAGSLIFPQMIQGLLAKLILQPLGIAALLGCVRMLRQGRATLYGLFTIVSLAMLLVWHFQPNQRFIMPVAPLLFAGFCFEMAHLAQLFRNAFSHRDRSQRVVAYGFAGFLGLVLATGLGLQIYMACSVVPELARDDRKNSQAYSSVYGWISNHLPSDASVLWEQDTAFYLATGRRSMGFIIPPREWYAKGPDDISPFRTIDQYASRHGLGYIMLTKVGMHRNDEVLRMVAANTNLERVHEEAGAILYRVR